MTKIIPRFLYHLTSKANYESIMRAGVLKATNADKLGECVYTIELTNLFKRWRGSQYWDESSLMESLVRHCSNGGEELVMLKIPTKNINTEQLVIRSQNRCFRAVKTKEETMMQRLRERNEAMMKFYEVELDKIVDIADPKEFKRLKAELEEITEKRYPCPNCDDLFELVEKTIKKCSPAKERKLFQQRKEAIEYIYPEDIPTSKFEKIGEVNVDELRKTAEYDPLKPMRSIFSALLKGAPEEKGALLLNC